MKHECFQVENLPFNNQINFVEENGEKKLLCRIRNILVRVTPEELVRQSLLSFMTSHLQKALRSQTKIEVERQDLDVVISLMFDQGNFSPALPPLLIIETKKKNIPQLDTEENEYQLKTYLKRYACDIGVLFNCDSMFCYQRQGSGFVKTVVTDLIFLLNIIDSQANKYKKLLLQHREYFLKAEVGEFEFFKKLIEIYGNTSAINFSYEQGGSVIAVSGFRFKIENDNVNFRLRGIYTRKKQCFKQHQFRNLISIEQISSR